MPETAATNPSPLIIPGMTRNPRGVALPNWREAPLVVGLMRIF
jgi:hypothetical protein